MKKTILVVLHKHDPPLQDSRYVIKYFVKRWVEQGFSVLSVNGTGKKIAADMVINHVDLTVTPERYIRYFRTYNKKINTEVTDISKTVVSNCILKPGTRHAGPVIVKTNYNCGGLKEEHLRMSSRCSVAAQKITSAFVNRIKVAARHIMPLRGILRYAQKAAAVLSARIKKATPQKRSLEVQCATTLNRTGIEHSKNWEHVKNLNDRNYPVFDSVRQVPAGVWNNKSLVVERFMPEQDAAGNYVCRYLYFLGDKSFCVVTTSENPVAKSKIIDRKIVPGPWPPELQEFRRRFCMGYGRLDYTVVDGKVYLFDANRTPTFGSETYAIYREQIDALSEGIQSFF